jgi:hypothetical protein
VRSVLEHLGSDLNGGRGHGDDGIFCVEELTREEADVAASPHDAASSEQATGPGRPQKLDMQVSRRGDVTGTESSWAHAGRRAATPRTRSLTKPACAHKATRRSHVLPDYAPASRMERSAPIADAM